MPPPPSQRSSRPPSGGTPPPSGEPHAHPRGTPPPARGAPPPKGPAMRWRGRQLAKRTHTRSRDDRCAGAGAALTPQPAHAPSDGAPFANAGRGARTLLLGAHKWLGVGDHQAAGRTVPAPPSLPILVEMASPKRPPPRRRVHGRGRRRPCRPADHASSAGGGARQDSSAAAQVGNERGLTR